MSSMSSELPATGLPAASISLADARARLLQLAYTILCPSLGRHRRTLIARVAVDRALDPRAGAGALSYADLRERVVRRTLATGRRRAATTTRVAGRRRVENRAEPDLAWLLPAARAAYALRHLEGLGREETLALLGAAGVGDPATATALADRILLDPPQS